MATRTGIIEVDPEGIVHCGDVMFAHSMIKYVGCQCSLTKYFDNTNDKKDKYPYFVLYPDKINYSERGVVQEAEDGRLHVGRYLLPLTNPSGVSKGSIIEIKQIHPIVNKEIPFFGNITDYTLIDLEHREVRDSRVFFLLDTNALIDCPTIFEHIDEDRPAIIESHVITELDGLKKADNVLTRNNAQQAHSQILEAQKQGKVKFATSKPPYLPFEEPASMDQKILAAAFLEEFLPSTVVLVSSDKNMLVSACSIHLQGIFLEDFLDGNYTIEAIEPDQKFQPKTGPNHRPDSGQEVLSIGPISKVSQYKVNLEKDLERKDQEYSQLVKLLGQSAFGEFMEADDETLSPIETEFRRKIKAHLDAISTALLLLYDAFFHTMLFKHWSWKEDKEQLEKHGVVYQNHTAEEIYNALSRINFDAVCLLFDNLECPLGIKETLRNSLSNKQEEAFVKTLNGLTCDLSILHFYSDYVSLLLGTIIGMFCDPQAIYDFIFHCDYGKLTDSFKDSVPSVFKKDMGGSMDGENKPTPSFSEALALADSAIIETLKMAKGPVDDMIAKGSYFPFEKKYVDRFLFNPDFQPYWEIIARETPKEEPQTEKPKEVVVDTKEPHWPSDEELLGYDDNYNTSEYFPYTIFGPAGHVKASEIKILFEILSSEYVLDDNLETQLIFLARYSGKIIPGLVLRPLKWAMVKDRDAALGFLILRTANGDYANAKRFFYFDTNGTQEMPTTIGPYAHNWDNLGPLGTSKKPLKMKLDAFLENYEE